MLKEALAGFVGKPTHIWPDCVCPVLIEFGQVLDAAMSEKHRIALLMPLVPLLVDTRDPASDLFGATSTALEWKRSATLVNWCLQGLVETEAAGATEEQQRCTAFLGEADEQLDARLAKEAAKSAAAAIAWAVKARWHLALGKAAQTGLSPRQCATVASVPCVAIWEGATGVYKEAAMLGPTTGAVPC